MASVLGLKDVSVEDTGKGSQLKTGNLKRSYNMPKSGKLSYKSLSECLKTAKSSSDSTACKQYFKKKDAKKVPFAAKKKQFKAVQSAAAVMKTAPVPAKKKVKSSY
jgi:hypothetical protein